MDSATVPHGLSITHLFVSYPATSTCRMGRRPAGGERMCTSHLELEPAVPLVPVTRISPGSTALTLRHPGASDGAWVTSIPALRAAVLRVPPSCV